MSRPADTFVTRIIAEHGDDLLRFLSRRSRTMADARDLAQETYIRLLRLDRKDLVRDPRAYVYRVAANLLYEFELKRRADGTGLRRWLMESPIEDGVSVPASAEALGLAARIETVLRELTPKCRAVLIMHRRDGMTYEEIGKQIGISASMVKKYLAIGLRHCARRLQDLR